MRLSILWGIMEIEEGVMRRGRRPRRINIAKTCLPPSIMKIGILPIVKNATHVTLSRYFNNSQSSLIAYNLSWLDFLFTAYPTPPSPPSEELHQHGPNGWAIAVVVIVTLVTVVGLMLGGLIWWKLKWRGTSPLFGYQKQPDESGFEL